MKVITYVDKEVEQLLVYTRKRLPYHARAVVVCNRYGSLYEPVRHTEVEISLLWRPIIYDVNERYPLTRKSTLTRLHFEGQTSRTYKFERQERYFDIHFHSTPLDQVLSSTRTSENALACSQYIAWTNLRTTKRPSQLSEENMLYCI